MSASDADAPQTPCQASALEPARAPESRAEPGQPERPAVTKEPQCKRERHRGERSGPRGQGRQSCSSSQEAAGEACHLSHGSRVPRSFGQRPERRPGGRHCQEFPKPHSRSKAAALAERKELFPEDPSPVAGTVDLKEEHHNMERWTPEQGAEAQSREKENLAFNRGEHRAASGWQGHHRPWDCRRWERSRVQDRGSYHRAPRGRGMFRPSGCREAHFVEKESSS